MLNKEKAHKAVAALNGKDLKGRTMMVNEARPGGQAEDRRRQALLSLA